MRRGGAFQSPVCVVPGVGWPAQDCLSDCYVPWGPAVQARQATRTGWAKPGPVWTILTRWRSRVCTRVLRAGREGRDSGGGAGAVGHGRGLVGSVHVHPPVLGGGGDAQT